MFDLYIKNARIIDGTGKDGYMGNIGIKKDKLYLSDHDEKAEKIIDVHGCVAAPGFIDAHSHGDQILGQPQGMLSKINQGITTEIAGQCGGSMFPVDPETLELAKGFLSIGTLTFPEEMEQWTSPAAYFNYAKKVPLAGNIKFLIGHSTLRIAVMGFDDRKPTIEELKKMKSLVKEAMEQGAAGLSTGLIYSPGCYADMEELVELAEAVKPYGGFYATHIRNESQQVIPSVKEALEIGRRAGVPVWISHHKAAGRSNWGKTKETLRLIKEANEKGMKVTLDQYPYDANMTNLNICIPPKYFETDGVEGMVRALKDERTRKQIKMEMTDPNCGYDNFYLNSGGFDGIFISGCPMVPEADGKFVSEYAKTIGKDPFDAYFDILIANGSKANGIFYSIGPEDMTRIITSEYSCIGTDGSCRSIEEKTHPRTFASFPKAIRYYHKEKGILTLPQMIRKMTGFPAERAGFKKKGLIKDGYDADLVIFDYDKIYDCATYLEPLKLSEGMEYVIVNGKIVYHEKQMTGELPGRIL